MSATFSKIDETVCDAYAELGAICLRGIFADWVELLRAGVKRNHAQPGPCEDWFPVLWPRQASKNE